MKKMLGVFLFLSCLTTTLYSQEVSEKEGKKVLEQIRREIQAEDLLEDVFDLAATAHEK